MLKLNGYTGLKTGFSPFSPNNKNGNGCLASSYNSYCNTLKLNFICIVLGSDGKEKRFIDTRKLINRSI